MAKPLLSFVIPCYRSAHTIGAVVRELNDTLAARADEYDHEIILVNDGSPTTPPTPSASCARGTPPSCLWTCRATSASTAR